ncbi:unnamed protein product [Symbiodinium sp. CCMP2456]|nr:unnamed protein product [Symbiodinium sp. CCMP2456]
MPMLLLTPIWLALARRSCATTLMTRTADEDKKVSCKILTIQGESITAGPILDIALAQNEAGDGLDDNSMVAGMNSGEAMFCRQRNRQCWLLSISGSTLKVVQELAMPSSRVRGNGHISRLWSDRVLYCYGMNLQGEMGNPYCLTIVCKDGKCSLGEKSHPNGSDNDRSPLSYSVTTDTLAPGRAVACAEDRAELSKAKATCAVYTLPEGCFGGCVALLALEYNETGFEESNVRALCDIAQSTKTSEERTFG